MTCVICKRGETRTGRVTVTLERGDTTIVVKSVPALVCDICGEQYIDADVSARVLQEAEAAARAGVQFEVRRFAAA